VEQRAEALLVEPLVEALRVEALQVSAMLTASAAGLTSAVQALTFVDGPDALAFNNTPPAPLRAGFCFALGYQTRKAGVAMPVTSNATVSFLSTPNGSVDDGAGPDGRGIDRERLRSSADGQRAGDAPGPGGTPDARDADGDGTADGAPGLPLVQQPGVDAHRWRRRHWRHRRRARA